MAANEWVAPEDYGARGAAKGSVPPDENDAWERMMAACRATGTARIRLDPSKCYGITNSFLFGGVEQFFLHGGGAEIMIVRPGINGAYAGPTANYYVSMPTACLANGTDVLTNRGPQAGSNYYGSRIRTVAPGARTLRRYDASEPFVAGERLLIYGFDRLQAPGFPPCPTFFEQARVTSVSTTVTRNDTATLANPLAYGYDEQWPDCVSPYGAARALKLDRAATTGEHARCKFSQMKYAELVGVTFVANPERAAYRYGAETEGKVLIGGADEILMQDCIMEHLYVSVCGRATLDNVVVRSLFEPDKLVSSVVVKGGSFGCVEAGVGCRTISMSNTDLRGINNSQGIGALGPIDLLEFDNVRMRGHGSYNLANVFNPYYSYGGAKRVFRNCVFEAWFSNVDRFETALAFSGDWTVASRTSIKRSWSDYQNTAKGRFQQNLQLGSPLRDVSGRCIGRVSRLPYCPDGNVTSGDVYIDVAPTAGPIGRVGETLTLYTYSHSDIEVTGLRSEGAYGRQVSTVFGYGNPTVRMMGRIKGLGIDQDAGTVTFASDGFPTNAAVHYMTLGAFFTITSVEINVSSPAMHGGSAELRLVGHATDTEMNVFKAINLKQTGRRLVSSSAVALTQTGDVAGATAFGGPFALLGVQNTAAMLGGAASGAWSVTLHGRFLDDAS